MRSFVFVSAVAVSLAVFAGPFDSALLVGRTELPKD